MPQDCIDENIPVGFDDFFAHVWPFNTLEISSHPSAIVDILGAEGLSQIFLLGQYYPMVDNHHKKPDQKQDWIQCVKK